jgi:hypothetical protein
LVLAELQENVYILSIFEEVFEAHNVIVMKTAMNLDFRHQLLFSTRLSEGSLGNNLGGRDSLSLKVSEFIALSETTFSEELPPEVFLNANVSVELDNFLFNDDLGIILLSLGWLSCLLWLLHVSLVFTDEV